MRASSAPMPALRRATALGRRASLPASFTAARPGSIRRSGPRAASVRIVSRPAEPPSGSAGRGAVAVAMTLGADLLGDVDLALEDLARRALGELVQEPDLARVLVVGPPLLDKAADLVHVGLGVGLEHDRGPPLLTHRLIGHRHHRRLRHGGMLLEHLLDLPPIHVVPAPDGHVLLAIADEEVTVPIHPRHVTRTEPS